MSNFIKNEGFDEFDLERWKRFKINISPAIKICNSQPVQNGVTYIVTKPEELYVLNYDGHSWVVKLDTSKKNPFYKEYHDK